MKILFLVVLQISIINSNFNIKQSVNNLKYILNYSKLKHSQCNRSDKVESFLTRSINFFENTLNIGDYLQYYNVSECLGNVRTRDNSYSDSYLKEHVLNGLLIHENVSNIHWDEYKTVHKKKFKSQRHEMDALRKWRENLKRVANHNREYIRGKNSYSLHLNHFGDMGSGDYFKKILKLTDKVSLRDSIHRPLKVPFRTNYKTKHPKEIDWRKKGFRPRLEEQWRCGACYAFAVTHALQAQLFIKHGDWRELSPQQIVDCSSRYGNSGCDGGSLKAALQYVAREGLAREVYYPYRGKRGRCRYTSPITRVRPRRWGTLPPHEASLERALVSIGPLAVAVNAAPVTFQLYRSGIYDDPFCTPWSLNHAMLLVGYTRQYWLLLNWWGRKWGEAGYIRIRRGFNRCGVLNMAMFVEM